MSHKNEQGHWQNKRGEYVHPDLVQVDKKLEDEVVEELVGKAIALQTSMSVFKTEAFDQCYDFLDLLRQNYNMERLAGRSGAVTLKNYDGTAEVQIAVAKLITFDQKLALAKEKVNEYLTEKTAHADPEIQTLILKAFDVKNGKVDAKQIISLKSYKIEHPKWVEAMAMIDDATEIAGTKSYIRFKERVDGAIDGELKTCVLDLASVPFIDADDVPAMKFEQLMRDMKSYMESINVKLTHDDMDSLSANSFIFMLADGAVK